MTLPLAGMTVLDLSRLLPGPLCSMHLQDFGARVIKLEDTGPGDYIRNIGMPQGIINPVFHILNRGKESISLDLAEPMGKALFGQLVAQTDIVLESFRPGVMAKLGLDYETLKTFNSKLVMCSLTGYGQDGPWAYKAGHDMNYCAIAGVLDQLGQADQPPSLSNFQIADIAGGALSAAMAILAGVVGALRTGEGRYLDISMTDCAFANHVIPLATMNLVGKAQPRGQDMLTGARPCYGLYKTADDQFMAVGALEEKFWAQLCEALQHPEWAARYRDTGAQAEQLRADVSAVFASQPQAYWRDVFSVLDCCVTPVLTPEAAFEHPQLLAREMIQTLNVPGHSALMCPAPAVRMDDRKHLVTRPGPQQGEHSRLIMQQLNYSETDINDWIAQGVVRQSPVVNNENKEKR